MSGRSGTYRDDIRLESDALRSQSWEPLAIALCRKVIDGDGLPIHVAEILQALKKNASNRVDRDATGSNVRKQSRGILLDGCARADSGHAAAVLPRSVMNSRRLS